MHELLSVFSLLTLFQLVSRAAMFFSRDYF